MLTTLTLAAILAVPAQDPMIPPVPKAELDAVSFFKGRYVGKGQGSDMQGGMVKMSSTSDGSIDMDRWMHVRYTYDMGSMGKMDGRMIFTYNATKHMYEGNWFDSMSESPMAFTGYTEGKYFVVNANHVMMGEMAMDMKLVFAKESASRYTLAIKFRPEGGEWAPVMNMDYSKR